VSDKVLEPPAGSSVPAVPASATPPLEQATASRGERARKKGYRSRFAGIYFLLAVLAGVGLAAFVVLLVKPDAAPAPKWSAWEPTGSDDAKARQVAAHVANRYRLKNGQQLVTALVGPPRVSAGGDTGDLPVRAIAIRPDISTGKADADDIDVVDTSGSLLFILCGLGQNCSITGGKASEDRHALLRRQALELSLYTFKYLPDINSVTIFLPPRPDGKTAPTAVFFKRNDVKSELKRPLERTLLPAAPGIGEMKGGDLANVNRLTRPNLYQYEYAQAQDGSAILVLDPVPLGS
jgi:hypothetical protein